MLPSLDQIVPTRAAQTAAEGISGPASLHLLVGPSGAGKSVIAHDLLRRHLDAGGAGLWIPAELADRETALSDAIDHVLRSLHPRAGVGSGHEALQLGAPDQHLLLVVDDVNRSPGPVRLLRKLIGWSRCSNSNDGLPGNRTVRIICPTWDAYWYPLRQTYESMSWIVARPIGPMARPEAAGCLKAALGERANSHTDAELDNFAERLHDDPILLGLFGRLLRADPSANPLAVSENVIGRMIEQVIGELAAIDHAVPTEYSESLNLLATEMIRRRVLYPSWSEVKTWFEADPVVRSRLAELAAQGHVCRVTELVGPPRLEFRHDRILDYHLSRAAFEMLLKEGRDREAVAEPFFIPFVGRAIARAELPTEVLEWVRQRDPVAVVAAVPYLPTGRSASADRIIQLARNWLDRPGDAPDSMRHDALWTLARANSPRVLDVTQGIQSSRLVWEAGLRNGDASAGSLALSVHFYPAVASSWIESLIEQARMHHGHRLTEELRALLRSKVIERASGRSAVRCVLPRRLFGRPGVGGRREVRLGKCRRRTRYLACGSLGRLPLRWGLPGRTNWPDDAIYPTAPARQIRPDFQPTRKSSPRTRVLLPTWVRRVRAALSCRTGYGPRGVPVDRGCTLGRYRSSDRHPVRRARLCPSQTHREREWRVPPVGGSLE
jgi:hypothetical protein